MSTHLLRFHLAVAVVAIGGTLLVVDRDDAAPSGAVVHFADPAIDESSGLLDRGGLLLTVNDSGADAEVLAVDARSGATAGHTSYAEEVVDVEAIAAGPDGSVWVGDIGDNAAQRPSVSAYRLDDVGRGDRTAEAQRFDLAYRDGPHDAETLLVHPATGRLFVVTKGLLGGRVYAAPARLAAAGVSVLRPVGEVGGMVTDGAFTPDGRHVLLRSYSTLTVYTTDGWREVASQRLPEQPQGEGLALPASGPLDHVLLSTEGAGSAVLSVPLSSAVRSALSGSPAGSPSGSPAVKPAVQPAGDESASGWLDEAADGLPLRPIGLLAVGAGVLALGGLLAAWVRAARRRSRSTR